MSYYSLFIKLQCKTLMQGFSTGGSQTAGNSFNYVKLCLFFKDIFVDTLYKIAFLVQCKIWVVKLNQLRSTDPKLFSSTHHTEMLIQNSISSQSII